jgi:hypothetical protein
MMIPFGYGPVSLPLGEKCKRAAKYPGIGMKPETAFWGR